MYSLIEIGILNAATAGVLALAVLLISRYVRRPAVVHALWVLVLLKLVTPPVFEIPVGLRLERLASLGQPDQRLSKTGTPAETSPQRIVPAVPIIITPNSNLHSEGQQPGDLKHGFANSSAVDDGAGTPSALDLRHWFALSLPMLVLIWATGCVTWFAFQGWRIVSFARFVRGGQLASDEVQEQAAQLAATIGVKRPPRILIVPATMSPILWAVGSRARVIFPAGLLDRVDEEARATLLTHEMAHFHRRDHWVRLLEFVVTGLFWWHPVVWIARREIEKSEEHCCDAWVVAQFPNQPRRYAEALLDTIDFLSEGRPRLVPVASGLGQAPFLRKRIQLIMSGVAAKSMSGTTRLAILAASVALLPLGPQVFESAIRRADAAAGTHSFTSTARISERPERETMNSGTKQVVDEFGLGRRSASKLPTFESLADELLASTASAVSVWAMVNSPDGRYQAIAKTDGELIIRDTFQQRTHDLGEYQISSIAFAPHRDLLVAGSADSRIYLFDCASGEVVTTFSGHKEAVASVAISLNGHYVASGSRDGVVKLWDVRYEREARNRVPVQSTAINCVRFSPDGRLLAIAGGDWRSSDEGTVTVWDLRGRTLKHRFNAPSPVGAVAFGNGELVIAEWNGRATSIDLRSTEERALATFNKDTVSAAALAADAQSLLIPAAEKTKSTAIAPVWFRRMDRNDDEQLAWNEFQGPRAVFRKLDADANDVVTWDEVGVIE